MFRFPWTNEHELNLDWIIRTVKSLLRRVKALEESGGGGGGADPYDGTPAALGTPSPGVSEAYARGDHVHPLPPLDSTLTIQGMAADAAATGDALAAKAPAVTEVTVSTAGDVTQAIDPGKLYHFTGALSSLTLTFNATATGQIAQYHFDFDSGSTAPTVTLPGTVTMQGGTFTPSASKHYEIDILNGYGVYVAW